MTPRALVKPDVVLAGKENAGDAGRDIFGDMIECEEAVKAVQDMADRHPPRPKRFIEDTECTDSDGGHVPRYRPHRVRTKPERFFEPPKKSSPEPVGKKKKTWDQITIEAATKGERPRCVRRDLCKLKP